MNKWEKKQDIPYLCIITPVFDPALTSLKFLVRDLQQQSYKSFILVCISNGASSRVEAYINKLRKSDVRFIFKELRHQNTPDWKKLLINIGVRRNFALTYFKAKRYIFIDADSQIIDKHYIAKLKYIDWLVKKDIIITQTQLPDTTILPFFPINLGRIDITCYSFSQKIALHYRFPENINEHYGIANDFRFFKKINSLHNTTYFSFLAVFKNKRSAYKKITQIYTEETNKIIA